MICRLFSRSIRFSLFYFLWSVLFSGAPRHFQLDSHPMTCREDLRGRLCSSEKIVIFLAVWQGERSNIGPIVWFPLQRSLPIPMALITITDQIITDVWCFTLLTTESILHFSVGRLLLNWALSFIIWKVASSPKQTCECAKIDLLTYCLSVYSEGISLCKLAWTTRHAF